MSLEKLKISFTRLKQAHAINFEIDISVENLFYRQFLFSYMQRIFPSSLLILPLPTPPQSLKSMM